MAFRWRITIIIWCTFALLKVSKATNSDDNLDFPEDFLFGVSTSAYQIEGGWKDDCKGPSIWDNFTHVYPEKIVDRSNGDVAADSYHQFEQDLNALLYMKVNFYHFSISWTRIFPNGDISSLNEAGIQYYMNIIDKLIQNDIKPMVTMYYNDLPHEIQKLAGFANSINIRSFIEYARVLFKYFGDKVKYWITFNSPFEYCVYGYGGDMLPPLANASGWGDYLCVDHTLRTHALVYRLYRKDFYEAQKGKIGITINGTYYFSKTNDNKLINRGLQFKIGWLLHPIYSESGGYPSIMFDVIGNNSKNEGRPWSRLPNMNEDDSWADIIKGTADFIGVNYYTSRLIEERTNLSMTTIPSWYYDSNIEENVDPSWKRAKSNWLYSVPEGLGQLLRWLRDEYKNTEVIITENGWSDDGELLDYDRIDYLRDHLTVLSEAIKDGCNVTGYAVRSLIDSFEWLQGYTEKFGLFFVDFQDPNRRRHRKKSAEFIKDLIETRKIPKNPSSSSLSVSDVLEVDKEL